LQSKPFPEYPSLHLHSRLPMVFVQLEVTLHPPLFTKHSLISTIFISFRLFELSLCFEFRKKKRSQNQKKIIPEQLNPFPEYPVLHEQLKLPIVFVQSAFI